MNYNLISVSDLAVILGCSKITIFRRVRSGEIPHKRIGRLIRFSGSDLQSYLDSIKVEKGGNNEKQSAAC